MFFLSYQAYSDEMMCYFLSYQAYSDEMMCSFNLQRRAYTDEMMHSLYSKISTHNVNTIEILFNSRILSMFN